MNHAGLGTNVTRSTRDGSFGRRALVAISVVQRRPSQRCGGPDESVWLPTKRSDHEMSESQTQEPDDEESSTREADFDDLLRIEGITLDGSFYCTVGVGDDAEVHEYNPSEVKGYDAVREDGEVVAQEVADVDGSLSLGVLEDEEVDALREKFEDGFGTPGIAVVEAEGEDDTGSSGSSEPDYEPMDDEEVIETIAANFEEHGFIVENDDDEEKVVSLAHPDARLMGYITGSHVGALPNDLETVDDYRNAVFQTLVVDADEPVDTITEPKDVPIAPEDMMEKFRNAGHSLSDEQKDKLSQQVKNRWEDGTYDHLRKDEEDDESEADHDEAEKPDAPEGAESDDEEADEEADDADDTEEDDE